LVGVQAAAGRPTLPEEHRPPPLVEDDAVDEVDDVAAEDPVVDAPPVTPADADAAWPPSPPAAEADDVSEVDPPLPVEAMKTEDEQAASPRAGTARVNKSVKEGEVFIPGA
jgi:hypothetical protein